MKGHQLFWRLLGWRQKARRASLAPQGGGTHGVQPPHKRWRGSHIATRAAQGTHQGPAQVSWGCRVQTGQASLRGITPAPPWPVPTARHSSSQELPSHTGRAPYLAGHSITLRKVFIFFSPQSFPLSGFTPELPLIFWVFNLNFRCWNRIHRNPS